jgi:hypothetical protein
MAAMKNLNVEAVTSSVLSANLASAGACIRRSQVESGRKEYVQCLND